MIEKRMMPSNVLKKRAAYRRRPSFQKNQNPTYFSMDACAAANRAIGTLKGEQLT
jgi:hypothetical protein